MSKLETQAPSHAASTSLIFGNAVWTVAAGGLPLLGGIVAIPILLHRLGTQRLGILTLAWAVIGYLGLLDLGLGRAITKFCSEKLAMGRASEIPGILWDALWVLIILGAVAGIGIIAFAHILCTAVFHVSGQFQGETTNAIRIIGLSVPLVTVGVAIRAVLEAKQSFAGISMVRAGAGFLGFIAPVAVLPFACRIDATVATLAVVRLLMVIALWMLAIYSVPGISRVRTLHTSGAVKLLRYGGWVTVSSVISPLMVYMDRFVIGALASVSVIAYYVTPQEMVIKLLIIPMALQSAVFPAFSGMTATGDSKTVDIYRRSMEAVVVVLLPAVVAVILLAPEALTLWLGADFSSHSHRVAQILAFALLINGVAHMPAALLQGSGRPDICAKLHLIEFPLYGALCYVLIKMYGIEGAAFAWLLRVSLDAGLLMFVAGPWVPRWPWGRMFSLTAAGALAGGVVLAAGHAALPARILYVVVIAGLSLHLTMSRLGFIGRRKLQALG
jgi:O-antigen/teichoic acid export membrane protein